MQHSQRTSQGVDSFAQFMEAQSKGQQEIDKAVARFADQSRATMERLQNSRGRRQRAAIAQLQKETKTVSDLVALVGSQHRSLREVLNYAKQIRDAASRVKRIRA